MDRAGIDMRYRVALVVLAAMAMMGLAGPVQADPNVNVTNTYPVAYGSEWYDMEFICFDGNYVIVSNPAGGSVPPRFEDVTVDGELRIPDGLGLSLAGTYTNDGLTVIKALDSWTVLHILGDVTIAGPGELRLNNDNFNRIDGYDGRLTNAADHLIAGAGQVGNSDLALTNHGIIDANRSSSLELHPMLSPGDGLASVVNDGTLRADGGSMVLHWGRYDNAGGRIEAVDGGAIDLYYGVEVTGGAVATTGDGVIRSICANGSSNPAALLADLTNLGSIQVAGGKRLALAGTIVNDGTIFVDGSTATSELTLDGNVTLSGTGSLMFGHGDRAEIIAAEHTKGSSETLTNEVGHTIAGSGEIYVRLDNRGIVEVAGGEELTFLANVVQIDGHVLSGGTWKVTDNGQVDPVEGGTLYVNRGRVELHGQNHYGLFDSFGTNEGTLAMSGGRDYIIDDGMFTNSGTVELGPGSELYVPDVCDEFMAPIVIGELTLQSAGTLAIGIDANGLSGTVETSDAWIDGGLTLSIDPNFDPGPLETIDIIGAMDIAGRFHTRSGEIFGEKALATRYGSFKVELVATVPGDASFDAVVDVTDLAILAARWKQSNADWSDADFSGDGTVDVTDLAILAANWNRTLAKGSAPVPEPSTLAVLFGASAWLVRSRRRRAKGRSSAPAGHLDR